MAERTVASFAGSTYLAAADAAPLDITGNLYLSCFLKLVSGTSGLILGKATSTSVSYFFSAIGGLMSFSVSPDGTPGSVVSQPASIATGAWYFLEGVHDATADLVRIALTPVSQTNLNTLSAGAAHAGGIHSGNAPFSMGGSGTIGYAIGQMHSVCLMNRIPSTAEREALFNRAAGVDYWELDPEIREGIAGFWSLKEASGSARLDRSGNGLTAAETGGAVATTTRTYTPQPLHACYGPSHELRKLLAASEAWQDLVGAATEEAAQGRIYIEAIHDEAVIVDKPNALIVSDVTDLMATTGIHSSGTRILQIRDTMPGGIDNQDAKILFVNRIGKIAEELMYHSGDAEGRLVVRRVTIEFTVAISDKENLEEPYQACQMRVEYGTQ